ncbi:MAG TPA: VanW family protein [Polyangiaceae bacterium]|nr:VanW family protein [Polyangiaceae bacterium]
MFEPRGPSAQDEKSARVRFGADGLRRRVVLFGLSAVGLGVLLATAWCIISTRDTERALPGVHVEGQDVSRLTRGQIAARVQAWAEQQAARKIALSLSGTALVFEPRAVGFRVDAAASAARALAVGRSGGFFQRSLSFFGRMLHPESVSLELALDPELLGRLEDEWQARAIKDAPFPGGFAVEGTSVTPLYPRAGSRLDRARVRAQLDDALRGRDPGPLAVHSELPRVDRAEVDRVVTQARAMLNQELTLATEGDARRLSVSPAQLGSILRIQVDEAAGKLSLACSPEATHALLAPQRAEFERAAESARFVIDAQDRVHVQPARPGVALDDQSVAGALCAAAQSSSKSGVLPLSPGAEPALSTAAAEQAGIAGLVGSYTTRHACCQPRVQNIHHIADLLDNTLVRPGETFSVNQVVGPRTTKNGFRPAPSIEDGDMVDTVGGGVSQFATTLFNALFYGGYDILERQPHSYWFTRYPMGYDATLSYPHPDIVFKNDTNACALIKTSYTETSITVKVYGDNGGRRVRAEVSEKQNIVMPAVEFIPNPRLDADEEKTRDAGMIGWSVTVKRILTYADGKTKEERRKVTYKPKARRVEVHPCRIPAGEPGHTGERCPVPEKDEAEASAAADAGAK